MSPLGLVIGFHFLKGDRLHALLALFFGKNPNNGSLFRRVGTLLVTEQHIRVLLQKIAPKNCNALTQATKVVCSLLHQAAKFDQVCVTVIFFL